MFSYTVSRIILHHTKPISILSISTLPNAWDIWRISPTQPLQMHPIWNFNQLPIGITLPIPQFNIIQVFRDKLFQCPLTLRKQILSKRLRFLNCNSMKRGFSLCRMGI